MPSLHHVVTFSLVSLSLVGCASAPDVQEEEGTSEDALSSSSCASSLAAGAVNAKTKAMLNTIAWSEGTAGSCGNDGYSTGFNFNCFSSCAKHPNKKWTAGGYTSSASGRYQFLSTTWSGLGLSSFSPRNQDLGGSRLISNRGVTLPSTRALTATEFSNAMKKLSKEWASLPFSPYGQPTKTLSQTRAKYCNFAGC